MLSYDLLNNFDMIVKYCDTDEDSFSFTDELNSNEDW